MLLRRGPPLICDGIAKKNTQLPRLDSLEFGKDPTTNFRLPVIMHQKRIVFMTHGKWTSIGLVDEYALKAWALICELMLLRRGSHLLCQLMLLRRGPSLVC